MKKILQMSALASVLALSIALPAAAAVNEEDAAAPAGSFTSDMPVPMSIRAQDGASRQQRFEAFMHERMMRRAEIERSASAR